MKSFISSSLMCADFRNLEHQIKLLEEGGNDYVHCDIMDGIFVPNYTLGTDILKTVRKLTKMPLDIHLMVADPDKAIDFLDVQMGEIVCVHVETSIHLQRTLQRLRAMGAKPGIAINPATPLEMIKYVIDDIDVLLIMTVNPGFAGQRLVPAMLQKIADAKKMIRTAKKDILIEVDGNVSYENAVKMRQKGADIFVAGTSAVFIPGEDIRENLKTMREYIA